MAFRGNPEIIARSTQRSVSNGAVPGPFFHRNQFDPHMAAPRRQVHLISSDLWEAITGERMSPASICQLLDSSIPQGDSPTSQSFQQMQCVMMARDKQGSRMIQTRLEEGNEQDRAFILNSLLPVLTGQKGQKEHDYLYFEFQEQNGKQAVRKGPWKLIYQNIRGNKPHYELYNLAADPSERHNVIDRFPDIAAELKEVMKEAHVESNDFPLL